MMGMDPGMAFIEKRDAIPNIAARPFLKNWSNQQSVG
jgi:hypothetical protein